VYAYHGSNQWQIFAQSQRFQAASLQRLIRSRSDDHRLQAAILGERLGMQAFRQRQTGRKRIIRNGVAIFVIALLGLAVRLLSG
jgi:hypothetical protein